MMQLPCMISSEAITEYHSLTGINDVMMHDRPLMLPRSVDMESGAPSNEQMHT